MAPRKPAETRLTRPATVTLALQGGGAHGAYTWGVLDRLLEEDHLTIEGIAGVSNGAINGVVLAQGMIHGGREGARRALRTYWRKVSTSARLSPLQPTLVDKMLGNNNFAFSPAFFVMDYITRVFSPYQFNVFDLNPLRDILAEVVDFSAIQKKSPVRLFIGATRVSDGRGVVFREKSLTLEKVLASACLPFLFKTVEVDGEPYWDGGYSGNPPLLPLVEHCTAKDMLIVQGCPIHTQEVPTQATDILDRVNEIAFNTNLLHDLRQLRQRADAPFAHMIEAEAILDELGRASKLNVDWDFLSYLFDTGRQAASDWLTAHAGKLGNASTLRFEDFGEVVEK